MTATIYTFLFVLTTLSWSVRYSRVRKGRAYAEGREPAESGTRFGWVGKAIFVVSSVLTIYSFWQTPRWLFVLYDSDGVRFCGIFLILVATLLHEKALLALGGNYSPCYDSYWPKDITKGGPYQFVRHPIYLANILASVGGAILSGSLWVIVMSLYGCGEIVVAVLREERLLSDRYPEYRKYQAESARLLPYVF